MEYADDIKIMLMDKQSNLQWKASVLCSVLGKYTSMTRRNGLQSNSKREGAADLLSLGSETLILAVSTGREKYGVCVKK